MNPDQLDARVKTSGGRLLKSLFDKDDQLIVALVAHSDHLRVYTKFGIDIYNWDALDQIRAELNGKHVESASPASFDWVLPYEAERVR